MPSCSAIESSSSSDSAGYSRSFSMPSPRSTSRFGDPTVSRQRKKVRSGGSSCAWRSMNSPMPSQSASSEVERKRIRVFSGGRSESARAMASWATQPVPLSLAPGTTWPAPM